MRLNFNNAAHTAHRNFTISNLRLEKSIEKLSSGYRINRAADGPGEVGVISKFESVISALEQAKRNTETAISLIQTADGGLDEVSAMLTRLSSLAVAASTDTYTAADRTNMQTEVTALLFEIDRISTAVRFNDQKILKGEMNPVNIHVGPNKGDSYQITIASLSTAALGINGLDITSRAKAESAIALVKTAVERNASNRAQTGAFQVRLQHSLSFLNTQEITSLSALSSIRDTDMAKEMVEFTKNQLITEAGAAMMSQANLNPRRILSLLDFFD